MDRLGLGRVLIDPTIRPIDPESADAVSVAGGVPAFPPRPDAPRWHLGDETSAIYDRKLRHWAPDEPDPDLLILGARNAKLHAGIGVSRAGRSVYASTYPSDSVLGNPKYGLNQLLLPFRRTSQRHPAAFCLTGPWQHNFYHCLVDYVPRLRLLRALPGADTMPIVIGPHRVSRVLEEAIAALGLPNPVVKLTSGVHRFDRLWLPTQMSLPLDSSSTVLSFLQSELRPALLARAAGEPPKRRRIYVTRKDAGIRRVVNDDAVMDLLGSLGFEAVSMSGLSLADQARLFYEADVIVAPHGAALANTVFCRPGTVVLEVFQQGHRAPSYLRIAGRLGLRYGFHVAEARGHDLQVDVEAVWSALEHWGVASPSSDVHLKVAGGIGANHGDPPARTPGAPRGR